MKVSVIIPTLNAEKYLDNLLEALIKQSYKDLEIIIIDSSSEDRTVKIAESYQVKTIVIPKNDFDHGGTRNIAVSQSSGDIIAFLTQDACPLSTDYIERLVEPLIKNPSIAASYGQQVAKDYASESEKFFRQFNYPQKSLIKGIEDIPKLGIKTFFFSNVCSAIRRKEFYDVGKFPQRVILNEDMILAAKLVLHGYKIAYVAEAKVWHSHHYNMKKQFQRYFDIGASLSMNNWIQQYAKPEGEGLRLLKTQVSHFIGKKHYKLIPSVIVENFVKYVGYKLGQNEKIIPLMLKKRLSMHSYYWDNREKHLHDPNDLGSHLHKVYK